jgi:ribosome-associated heat shock protein Hsp15
MTIQKGERIDKFLWHVRLFSSRSAATEACRRGRVEVDGQTVKPSHSVSEGATVIVRKPPVTYSYLVIAIPVSRVGAKLVPDFISDLTPDDEKNKLLQGKITSGYRPRGTGRPTKRERRELDDLMN